jgi:hypothetical protein
LVNSGTRRQLSEQEAADATREIEITLDAVQRMEAMILLRRQKLRVM